MSERVINLIIECIKKLFVFAFFTFLSVITLGKFKPKNKV